jgi:hypothetical protein
VKGRAPLDPLRFEVTSRKFGDGDSWRWGVWARFVPAATGES